MTMAVDHDLQRSAERALQRMRARGFDAAQVGVSRTERHEVCVAHNEPSLLRSNESVRLRLAGLLDGRRADGEASELDDENLDAAVDALWASVQSAPHDDANAVSADQSTQVVRGPLEADLAVLTGAMRELLDWRAAQLPTVMLEEALAGHNHATSCVLTSAGSAMCCELGWFDAMAFGLAREGAQASSFNYAGGSCDSLSGTPFVARFGLDEMMRALARQVHTQPLGERFVGTVVLTPRAVTDLLEWLFGELADQALIDGSSVYRQAAGEVVASPLLTLTSRFDAPGVVPWSADAFVLRPVEVLTRGRLNCLTPSLYGSRKTGLPHVPTAGAGWALAPGDTPLQSMIDGVERGALVDRLSMGRPAASGDFSGVIKNSFLIEGGRVGAALSETMIAGNVAQMLRDVSAVSVERTDTGDWLLPWLSVPGLHFS